MRFDRKEPRHAHATPQPADGARGLCRRQRCRAVHPKLRPGKIPHGTGESCAPPRSTGAPSVSTCTRARPARAGRRSSVCICCPAGGSRRCSRTRERAALAWTECLTRLPYGRCTGRVYDALQAQFSPVEIANLTTLIGLINLWNRIGLGFRLQHPVPAEAIGQARRPGPSRRRHDAGAAACRGRGRPSCLFPTDAGVAPAFNRRGRVCRACAAAGGTGWIPAAGGVGRPCAGRSCRLPAAGEPDPRDRSATSTTWSWRRPHAAPAWAPACWTPLQPRRGPLGCRIWCWTRRWITPWDNGSTSAMACCRRHFALPCRSERDSDEHDPVHRGQPARAPMPIAGALLPRSWSGCRPGYRRRGS